MAKAQEGQYDDTGVFSFFFLSILTIYLIPTTFSRIRSLILLFFKKQENESSSQNKIVEAREGRKEKKKTSGLPIGHIVWVAAWILFFFLLYSVSEYEPEGSGQWNPFEILSIPEGATDKEIKDAYKALSLKLHPDKNKGKEEEAQMKFIEVSKAYKALTDPQTRENWEKYGNPDGRREFSMGIALPQWMVRKENSGFVLGFYLLLLVGMVVAVWYWWRGSRSPSSTDVNDENAKFFYFRLGKLLGKIKSPAAVSVKKQAKLEAARKEGKEAPSKEKEKTMRNFTVEDILRELVKAPEYRSKAEETEEQKKFFAEIKNDRHKIFLHPEKDWQPLAKILYLFNFHLKREPVPEFLKDDFDFIIKKSIRLLKFMIDVGAHFNNFSICEQGIHLQQMIIQCVWEKNEFKAEFCQLPHMNDRILSAFQKRKPPVTRISELLKMPDAERAKLLTAANLTEEQQMQMMDAACQIPYFSIKYAKFYVKDETEIYAGDFVTFHMKFIVKYGYPNEDQVNQNDDSDEDEERQKRLANVDVSEVLPIYAPLFPEEKYPSWWIVMVENKSNKVVMAASVKEITTRETIHDGNPINVKVQFKWPKPGKTRFNIWIFSDSYIGIEGYETAELNQLAAPVEEKTNNKKEKETENQNDKANEDDSSSGSEAEE